MPNLPVSSDPSSAPRPSAETDRTRFDFGRNWTAFSNLIDQRRMDMARQSLTKMLGVESLEGKSFLDAGSGSGLFSLAAAQLDAAHVVSFDYDDVSVACTEEVKRRFFPDHPSWSVQQGDCLDRGFLESLGEFDVVYSWGVLHHTGDMWRALENVSARVAPGGTIYLSIYNDQGRKSRFWRRVKRFYCRGPFSRACVVGIFVPLLFSLGLAGDLSRGKNPLRRYREPRMRGMSVVRDWYDWLGGYPFEVARPEAVFAFLRDRGFQLTELKTVNGLGCNEFVFRRTA